MKVFSVLDNHTIPMDDGESVIISNGEMFFHALCQNYYYIVETYDDVRYKAQDLDDVARTAKKLYRTLKSAKEDQKRTIDSCYHYEKGK